MPVVHPARRISPTPEQGGPPRAVHSRPNPRPHLASLSFWCAPVTRKAQRAPAPKNLISTTLTALSNDVLSPTRTTTLRVETRSFSIEYEDPRITGSCTHDPGRYPVRASKSPSDLRRFPKIPQ